MYSGEKGIIGRKELVHKKEKKEEEQVLNVSTG